MAVDRPTEDIHIYYLLLISTISEPRLAFSPMAETPPHKAAEDIQKEIEELESRLKDAEDRLKAVRLVPRDEPAPPSSLTCKPPSHPSRVASPRLTSLDNIAHSTSSPPLLVHPLPAPPR